MTKYISRFQKRGLLILLYWLHNTTLMAQVTMPNRFAISNVAVITMNDEKLLHNRAVIIDHDTIMAIVPVHEIKSYKPVKVIDGRNGFLMPGLTESHCHLSAYNSDWLQVFLDFGITSIHVMTGSEHAYSWRNLVRKRKLTAPDIILASNLIDGNPPIWGANHNGPVIESIDSVAYYIEEYASKTAFSEPYDMLKLYARLKPAVFLKFLELANKADIRVAAHIPVGFNRDIVLHPFISRIEHLSGYGRMCTMLDSFTSKQWEYQMDHILDRAGFVTVSETAIEKAVQQTVSYGIWNCPTQTMFENEIDTVMQHFLLQSSFAKSFPGLTNWWRSIKKEITTDLIASVHNRRLLIQSLHQGGAKILAGTDSPNPFLYPGLALHQELINYCEKAGLTPFESLQTATVNPGLFMNVKTGKIQRGYKAHLVLLKQNPLKKIYNTLTLLWTLKDGQLFNSNATKEFFEYYQTK
jgi:Amidohydrolase family